MVVAELLFTVTRGFDPFIEKNMTKAFVNETRASRNREYELNFLVALFTKRTTKRNNTLWRVSSNKWSNSFCKTCNSLFPSPSQPPFFFIGLKGCFVNKFVFVLRPFLDTQYTWAPFSPLFIYFGIGYSFQNASFHYPKKGPTDMRSLFWKG